MRIHSVFIVLLFCLPALNGATITGQNQELLESFVVQNDSNFDGLSKQLFFDCSTGKINLLPHIESFQNDTWILETVDGLGKICFDTNIAIDAVDTLHISYHDFGEQDLKYAKNRAGLWTVQNVDTAGDVGIYNDIAIDKNNIPHISYYDTTHQDLKYATLVNDVWHTNTVDTTGDVGSYNAIAIDKDNVPHISYYDSSSHDLKYATFIGNSWTAESVDMTDEVGSFTDIAVDNGGRVHITYYAATDNVLRYALGTRSSWDITDAVKNVRVFGATSIALDGQQTPHICYYDLTNYDIWYLKYAYPANRGWVTEVIDPNLYYFWNAPGLGIAVDDQGNVHIGYAAWKRWNLNYAWRSDGVWHVELVESDGNVGAFASLALDSHGYPHISYIDRSNLVLKHAHKIQYPPNNPAKPDGPLRIASGTEHTYSTSTVDMDDDEVKYGWDWDGDRVADEWTEFFASGEQITATHVWNTSGSYGVRVRAEDIHGHQSNWSEPLSIVVPNHFDHADYLHDLLNDRLAFTRRSIFHLLVFPLLFLKGLSMQ